MTSAPSTLRMREGDDDFARFLDEVAREVESHVEAWRLRVGEAAARWRAAGMQVAVLERALRLPAAPDVDALLATFGAAVARLQALEARATAIDPALAAHPAFRDPARLAEAEAMVRALVRPVVLAGSVDRAPNAGHSRSSDGVDAENWVLEWPDVRDLLVEVWP